MGIGADGSARADVGGSQAQSQTQVANLTQQRSVSRLTTRRSYLCVVALLTLVQGFLNPILIIGLGLVGGLGFVVYTQGEKVKVGSVEVTQMQATIAIGVST